MNTTVTKERIRKSKRHIRIIQGQGFHLSIIGEGDSGGKTQLLERWQTETIWQTWLSVTHAVRESHFLKDNVNRNDGVKRVREQPEREREGEPQQTVRGW